MGTINAETKETFDVAFRPIGKKIETFHEDDKYWTSIHMKKTVEEV